MQQQYRAFAQSHTTQQRPPPTNQRRGGIGPMMSAGPHPSVPLTQAQMAQQQQAQAHATEMAKRRSRKPTDKNIPEGTEDSVVDPEGVQRYKDLRALERQLDATLMRKRLDLIDNADKNTKLQKTLRLWISNTVDDQAWQGAALNVDAFDFAPSVEASYRVKIEGQLLDISENEDINAQPTLPQDKTGRPSTSEKSDVDATSSSGDKHLKARQPRLSIFFKEITVDFDPTETHGAVDQPVEWKRPDPQQRTKLPVLSEDAEFDEFAFKRHGDENVNIMINLHRQESPERYHISPLLADVIDMQEATQQEAVMALWEYIRVMGLQEDEEKRNFRCDFSLRKVIGSDIGHIPLLNEYVTQNLQPLPPIKLPYTIRVDEAFHKDPRPTVYDIQVAVEDPFQSVLQSLTTDPRYAALLKDVTLLDDQLARLVQAIAMSKAKHGFLTSLAADPAQFINTWLNSQKRDLDIIMGEGSRSSLDNVASNGWRQGGKSDIWTSRNARESINVLLSKQR